MPRWFLKMGKVSDKPFLHFTAGRQFLCLTTYICVCVCVYLYIIIYIYYTILNINTYVYNIYNSHICIDISNIYIDI